MKKNKVPGFVITLLLCLLCTVVTAACCLLMDDDGATSDKYLSVINILQENSIVDTDVVKLEDAAARAIVDSLEDDWSYYLNADEYKEYQLYAANEYVGIGVKTAYNSKYGYLAVTSVAAGSPAAAAQIEIGNMITSVNNTDVSSFTPEDLEGYLKSFGEEKFRLGLQNAQGGTRTVEMQCQVIFIPPVSWSMQADQVGYISVSNFESGCSSYIREAASDLRADGARALILDMRDNPGGLVSELKDTLDYLLPKGDLFICRDRNGKETMYSSDSNQLGVPLVIMVNKGTENEAEMFALVMQSFGAATIVGERTSGNGHNQVVIPLEDGSAVRVSKYTYLSAERKTLATLGGVVPDVRSTAIADSSLDVIFEAAMDEATAKK